MQHILINVDGSAFRASNAFVVPCTRKTIGAAIDAFLFYLDALDGDADLEPDADREPNGDELDAAWVEWVAMRGAAKRGANFHAGAEDAEEDDGGGDDCTEDVPGFDLTSRRIANLYGSGAGCSIAGDAEPNGDEGDYTGGI